MNREISTEELVNAIGNMIYDLVGDDKSKVIAYSEVEHNVVECSIFYCKEYNGRPFYLSPDTDLVNLIYEFWSRSDAEFGEHWAAMTYCLIDGNVQLQIIYKDKFNSDIDRMVRSRAVVQNFFGRSDISYEHNSNQ